MVDVPHPDKPLEEYTRAERLAVIEMAKQSSLALVQHIERLEQIERMLAKGAGEIHDGGD